MCKQTNVADRYGWSCTLSAEAEGPCEYVEAEHWALKMMAKWSDGIHNDFQFVKGDHLKWMTRF